ncbi:hypothetical protein ACOMHN_064671 [Nucella lapillus]
MMLMVARDNVWTDEKHQLSAGEEAFILVRFLVMLEFYPHICKSSITLFVSNTTDGSPHQERNRDQTKQLSASHASSQQLITNSTQSAALD